LIYKVILTPDALEDLEFWRKHDKRVFDKIGNLLRSVAIDPTYGIGKPEKLRYKNENLWSRRITREHRLVYLIEKEIVYVLECRFHYK